MLALAFALTRAAPLRAAPRLLVVVSVDQMRADYLDRFAPEFKGGLARLVRDGAVFTQARQVHVPTETAPGHAAILTGRAPAEHGIVSNDWYDRGRGAMTYAVEDPLFGRSPANLEAYTLGDALKARDPGSKVACVSQKDRAAILLCGKRPDAAVWYQKKTGLFTTSAYYGELPAWAKALDDRRPVDARWRKLNPKALEPAPTSFYEQVLEEPFSDELVLELGEAALSRMGLGLDGKPDLLALSFSANDYAGHRWGPDSPQVRDILLSLDRLLGRLLTRLDGAVGAGRYALALTADHGVSEMAGTPAGDAVGAKTLPIKELKERLEAALDAKFPPEGGKWVLALTDPYVWLDRALAARRGVAYADLAAEAARALKAEPLIAEVFEAGEVAGGRAGPKPYADRVRRSLHRRSGDLVFFLREHAQLDYGYGEPEAEHSQPYDYDARVPLVLFGAGIAQGRFERPVAVLDLAPTAARLLGVAFAPATDAAVLGEALAPAGR